MPFSELLSFNHGFVSVSVAVAYLFLVRPMRSLITSAVFIAMCLSIYASKETLITVDEARRQHLLFFVRPDYPLEARRNRWTGRGVFSVTFDFASGRVQKVQIVRGTGHPLLDSAATAALKQWRAKPKSLHKLADFPIVFTHSRR
jgi:TonB family protein